jgi:hypothetical protein
MHANLRDFNKQWRLPDVSANSPVFVLSAGWRSGSTLLQRLLCSSGELIVWGEPYARCRLVQHLAASTQALSSAYPHTGHLQDLKTIGPIENQWIANWFPPPSDFRLGIRAALDTVLAHPAHREGFARFGLKEVRLDADHGRFLQWVYPDARFVAVVRNPWDAWRSAKGLALYLEWPGQPMNTPAIFARHWLKLVQSFSAWQDESVFFFRYEDLLRNPQSAGVISAHCGLGHYEPSVMNRVVGSSGKKPELSEEEVFIIHEIAGEAAGMLGYTPKGNRIAA